VKCGAATRSARNFLAIPPRNPEPLMSSMDQKRTAQKNTASKLLQAAWSVRSLLGRPFMPPPFRPTTNWKEEATKLLVA
jgi:hypothetical protein